LHAIPPSPYYGDADAIPFKVYGSGNAMFQKNQKPGLLLQTGSSAFSGV